MMTGAGATNHSSSAANAVNTALSSGGNVATISGTSGGSSQVQKEKNESSTAPKFGEIYQQIQAQYGAKAEKPREIKKTLGKDDFLKIMIMQMRYQDPSSPFKPEQMASQMAQFASVEQLQNVNQNVARMAQQNSPLERLAMTNMIGKTVTVDRERFPHTEGTSEPLSFVLPKDAKEVKVAVVSEAGETVFGKDLGSLKAGENSLSWDGLKTNSLPAKAGTYMLRVEAVDDNGQSLNCSRKSQARIVGVSFEGAEPVFLIGDARHQEKITLRNIIRVDNEGPAIAAAPAQQPPRQSEQQPVPPSAQVPGQSAGGITSVPQENAPNLFTFQKGVGSGNFDPAKMSPEVREAIAKYQGQPQQVAKGPAEEKGFPNGLHDN